MLAELRVEQMGVIDELSVAFGPGMTAITGETGAGKTMVVEAIELLTGGRADPVVVRAGAEEARVEGRFVVGDDEVVVARVIPRDGRSRAYVDGRLATAATLAELGAGLVDVHGQHASQSLVQPAVQRAALDQAGSIDVGALRAARALLAELDTQLAALGGDDRARAREVDLLRFQLAEIDAAAIVDADEPRALEREEDLLAAAVAHREASARAGAALTDDAGALDHARQALAALGHRSPFAASIERLRGLVAELDDLAAEVRDIGEAIPDDPQRLEAARARRQQLHDLCRKYGDDLPAVNEFRDAAAGRLAELESHEQRAAELERARVEAMRVALAAEAAVGAARRAEAPHLGAAVQVHLRALGLGAARFSVEVGEADPGDEVRFLFAANPGEVALPLARVASGGELARAMLALRLVLTDSPPTLVFDEVDAGIGGEAALAVGRSLAALSGQVLVVTHLPQVAAYADTQLVVRKSHRRGRTVASVSTAAGPARVEELSRMMSGIASSGSAQRHAAELLELAARDRKR